MVRSFILCVMALMVVRGAAQTPGFYFGPRFAVGAAQFTGRPGFTNGVALQVGVHSSKQLTEHFAVQFSPHVAMYNAQRQSGEGDGVYPNGQRKILVYWDKYNIYSVEFPLMVKFGAGFRRVYFSLYAGPSLGYIMGGTRSKKYEDVKYNAENGYSGHAMDDLKRGMYSVLVGASAEMKIPRGLLSIDFRVHHNLSPIGRLEGIYFSAGTRTVGVAWMFNATPEPDFHGTTAAIVGHGRSD